MLPTEDEERRPYHAVANLFPLLQGEEYEQLKADIAANGLREAIWLHPDGSIIDGRNRHRACLDTGTPLDFRVWDGCGSLVAFVVSLNLHRRHLNQSQKAAIGLEVKRQLQEENPPGRPAENVRINSHISGRNSDAAGKLVGVSGRYIDMAETIERDAPDMFEQVRAGELTLTKAQAELKARETLASVAAYTESVRDAPALEKVYNVIYADPPWDYGYKNPEGVNIARKHYHTMPLEDICAFLEETGVKVADNAVLFLWVTNPFLVKALKVVEAWGFSYKTNIVWVKTERKRLGAGHYVRGQHELLFICTRGQFTPLDKHLSPPVGSVLESPQREHSEKPDEVYEIIERLYPGCTYLELFARAGRSGWEGIGNEIR